MARMDHTSDREKLAQDQSEVPEVEIKQLVDVLHTRELSSRKVFQCTIEMFAAAII